MPEDNAVKPRIEFDAVFETPAGETTESVTVSKVIVGGWTGRDRASLQHHIDELAKIGVVPPERTPMFYRVGLSRLSVADAIEVIGEGSSGEVEYLLLKHGGQIWVGVGSDHTDRVYEKVGITPAKQLCDKPIARRFWLLSDIEPHWDQLVIRSHIVEDENEVLYQEGGVASLLSPGELLQALNEEGEPFDDGTVLFGGTCGAIGDVRFSSRFSVELFDPVRSRSIRHGYDIYPVPIRG